MVPRGYKFLPSFEDLIYFLKVKLNGGKTTGQPLGECDMYGNKEPWEIWNDHGGLKVEQGEDLYFFTKLKKMSANGRRVNRRVGSGTWSNANWSEVVDGVGEKKHFRYENNGGHDHGAWIMHEYRLFSDHHHNHYHGDDEYVLCRLRKKTNEAREKKKIKLMNNKKTSEARERKRIKLMNNNNIIIQEDDHHPHQPTQYHHQETNINNLFPNDDDIEKLKDYNLNLPEQEIKGSLSPSSCSGGAAADDYMNNVNIQEDEQHTECSNYIADDDQSQQHTECSNYITDDDQIGFDDLCDWGVVFAADHDIDDDELMGNNGEEFHIHKKPSSSSSTAGAETFQNQGGDQQEKAAKGTNVVVPEDGDQDEAFDKFLEKLEDMLEGDEQHMNINHEQVMGGVEVEDDIDDRISYKEELQKIPFYFEWLLEDDLVDLLDF